mgnify:CR=1
MQDETTPATPAKRRGGPRPTGEPRRVMVSVPAPMAEPIKELVKAWREKHKARKE